MMLSFIINDKYTKINIFNTKIKNVINDMVIYMSKKSPNFIG